MAQRMLRLRLTRGANDGIALLGSLENFRQCLAESTLWFYEEPVTVTIGGKRVWAGSQPAISNGRIRLLLTDADSDEPCWDYDIERVIVGATKSSKFHGGERAEVEILPFDVAKQQEKVEDEVVAAAPTVKPIRPSPPSRPARKCPHCGAELEADVIGLICSCGAKLPDALAREFEFAVLLYNDWEKLAEFHRKRILVALFRAERGRKFSRQLAFEDRYATLLRAETPEASSVADMNVLREVLADLEDGTGKRVGEVITDTYELKQLWKMLCEKYPKSEIWRKDEEQ